MDHRAFPSIGIAATFTLASALLTGCLSSDNADDGSSQTTPDTPTGAVPLAGTWQIAFDGQEPSTYDPQFLMLTDDALGGDHLLAFGLFGLVQGVDAHDGNFIYTMPVKNDQGGTTTFSYEITVTSPTTWRGLYRVDGPQPATVTFTAQWKNGPMMLSDGSLGNYHSSTGQVVDMPDQLTISRSGGRYLLSADGASPVTITSTTDGSLQADLGGGRQVVFEIPVAGGINGFYITHGTGGTVGHGFMGMRGVN